MKGGGLFRRRRRSAVPGELGPVQRFLFSFMGPPELGDPDEPHRPAAPGPVALCPKCRQPYDEHEVVRDPRLTYTRCPAPPPG